jgi:hypothetical protein
MEPHEWMNTKSLKVDFKRSIRDNKIQAKAKAVRSGDSIQVEVRYIGSEGKIAHIATVEQMVRSTKNESVIQYQWNKAE